MSTETDRFEEVFLDTLRDVQIARRILPDSPMWTGAWRTASESCTLLLDYCLYQAGRKP